MTDDLRFQDWIDRAKTVDIRSAAERLGARLKKAGAAELQGPCPKCGGTDRFSIHTGKHVFNCRGGGGGGVVDMAMHVLDCNFVAACEFLTNEAPPDRASEYRAPDPEIIRERKEERRDEQTERARQESGKLAENIRKATDLFNRAAPVIGTLAEDYLTDWRGIPATAFEHADLRFMNEFPYMGADPENPEGRIELGRFPCMLAAMRNPAGQITGIKRTYLGRDGRKLKTPDGGSAKLGLYTMAGGIIHLMPIGETLALGEGVETTLGWLMLAREGIFGPDLCEATVAGADSLNNLASPYLEFPGQVRRLIYLVDGDSNPVMTRQTILKGAEANRALGLDVSFSCAPTDPVHFKTMGRDWNDVWLECARVAA